MQPSSSPSPPHQSHSELHRTLSLHLQLYQPLHFGRPIPNHIITGTDSAMTDHRNQFLFSLILPNYLSLLTFFLLPLLKKAPCKSHNCNYTAMLNLCKLSNNCSMTEAMQHLLSYFKQFHSCNLPVHEGCNKILWTFHIWLILYGVTQLVLWLWPRDLIAVLRVRFQFV